jgi:hypothetical protein
MEMHGKFSGGGSHKVLSVLGNITVKLEFILPISSNPVVSSSNIALSSLFSKAILSSNDI